MDDSLLERAKARTTMNSVRNLYLVMNRREPKRTAEPPSNRFAARWARLWRGWVFPVFPGCAVDEGGSEYRTEISIRRAGRLLMNPPALLKIANDPIQKKSHPERQR